MLGSEGIVRFLHKKINGFGGTNPTAFIICFVASSLNKLLFSMASGNFVKK